MKRIKAACLCQTLHFQQKEKMSYSEMVRLTDNEVETYRQTLERNHTQYRILDQIRQPDGSIILKVLKQYNQSPVGDYLNGTGESGA